MNDYKYMYGNIKFYTSTKKTAIIEYYVFIGIASLYAAPPRKC